jgi:hypothetical protein
MPDAKFKGFDLFMAVVILLALTGPLTAHPRYTGASGAPGRAACASTCHGLSGGTIAVTGFPGSYAPGQVYTVKVAHGSGGAIANFNGSCRVGAGSTNAGTIARDYNTSTYNTTGETNGVHFANPQQDSGTFFWTAPAFGTGVVRLYLAGMQGDSAATGLNTTLVLTAAESGSGVEERTEGSRQKAEDRIRPTPNPFTSYATISEHKKERFNLYDVSGRVIGLYKGDRIGEGLAPGVYFLKPEGKDAKPVRIVKLR